ncbi:MAG: protein kinase [Nitrospirae bacterium]|nr:protein kinase [Nitrospirota bacterium]
MPRIYGAGEVVNGYRIVRPMNQGNFANAYEAADTSARRIFLKQYIDPTPVVGAEYERFVEHQKAVKSKLDRLTDVVEKNHSYFEFDGCYFQAKEFMEGVDLETALYESDMPLTDEQRFLLATVMMYSMSKIHEKGIVHTDLKPAQIYMREDNGIGLRYRIKIVDFDFCRLPDVSEPIHICTSPYYSSPEHLKKGLAPHFGSDIFTCGLILYEILGGEHPYPVDSEDKYARSILDYSVKKLRDLNPAVSQELSDTALKMLDPNIDRRPSAADVHKALQEEINRRKTTHSASEDRKKVKTLAEPCPSTHPKDITLGVGRVEFHHPSVKYSFSVHKTTCLGRGNFRAYGEDYKYLEDRQFEIIMSGGGWNIKGLPSKNPTLLNGSDITNSAVPLKNGDDINIGPLKLAVKII